MSKAGDLLTVQTLKHNETAVINRSADSRWEVVRVHEMLHLYYLPVFGHIHYRGTIHCSQPDRALEVAYET